MDDQRGPGRPRVTRDVNNPAYPHGTETGYLRGCSQECCLAAHRRTRKEFIARKAGILPPKRVPAGPVLAHLNRLIGQGAKVQYIANASGVSRDTVRRMMSEHRGQVAARNAAALLAVTMERIEARHTDRHIVDPRRTIQQIRSMQALGYPLRWQMEQVGYTGRRGLLWLNGNTRIVLSTAALFDRLARRVGDRWASAADGLSQYQISRAKAEARRAGFYVPGAYDDDGTLIPGAARSGDAAEQLVTAAERRARLILDGLRRTLAGEGVSGDSTSADMVRQFRRRIRLTVRQTSAGYQLAPGTEAVAAMVRRVIADVEVMRLDPADAVEEIERQAKLLQRQLAA